MTEDQFTILDPEELIVTCLSKNSGVLYVTRFAPTGEAIEHQGDRGEGCGSYDNRGWCRHVTGSRALLEEEGLLVEPLEGDYGMPF